MASGPGQNTLHFLNINIAVGAEGVEHLVINEHMKGLAKVKWVTECSEWSTDFV